MEHIMKITIHTQDLEARGNRFKYAGGETYVIRDIAKEELDKYINLNEWYSNEDDIIYDIISKM